MRCWLLQGQSRHADTSWSAKFAAGPVLLLLACLTVVKLQATNSAQDTRLHSCSAMHMMARLTAEPCIES